MLSDNYTYNYTLNISTQGVQELFFKAPGVSSTQWTLKSYDKGNSYTYTGPRFPAFNVIIEFNTPPPGQMEAIVYIVGETMVLCDIFPRVELRYGSYTV